MAFYTLTEAADYARFACAAYAVVKYEDTREERKIRVPKKCCSTGCGCCCCCCCGGQQVSTSEEVRR